MLYPQFRVPPSGSRSVDDTRLGAMLVAAEALVDDFTRDHFEATTITQRVTGNGATDFLYVPKRVRSVSAVTAYDFEDTDTAITSTYYQVHSSFDISDTNVFGSQGRDGLKLRQALTIGSADGCWPAAPWYFDVEGTFDWAVTPEQVKQATAMIVWSWTTSEIPPGVQQVDSATARYVVSQNGVMDDVARLLSQYRRFQVSPWGVAI